MLSGTSATYIDIVNGIKIRPERVRGDIKEKYERDHNTMINKGNLEIAITMWLNLDYDCKKYSKPSWRILAEVMYDKDETVFRRILDEHPKKK